MRMNKEDLKKTLAEKKDTMEELARSQPMEVKTIDNMRLSLLAIEVKTIVQLYQYMRDVCSTKLLNTTSDLGGPGVVVQIDESLFNHKSKYQRGRRPDKGICCTLDGGFAAPQVHQVDQFGEWKS
jgi:hypothetical protein